MESTRRGATLINKKKPLNGNSKNIGKIRVDIIEAKILAEGAKLNPFVVIKMVFGNLEDSRTKKKTPVMKANNNPIFHSFFIYDVVDFDDSLVFTVWDKDKFHASTKLGYSRINFKTIFSTLPVTKSTETLWMNFEKGRLRVAFTFEPNQQEFPKLRVREVTLSNINFDLETYRKQLEKIDPQQSSNVKLKGFHDMVSLNKKRFKNDKYDLDLAYITDRIIAMGFPSAGVEKIYRNPMETTQNFLNEYHPNAYKVYNLCAEADRKYPHNKFFLTAEFGFNDHNPPGLEMINNFCMDLNEWFSRHDSNVAAIHCKAGKGRTGLMVCCFLIYRYFDKLDAQQALEFYAERRTRDKKGVTIPSQQRFVNYWEEICEDMKEGKWVSNKPVKMKKIVIENPPLGLNTPTFIISTGGIPEKYIYNTEDIATLSRKQNELVFEFKPNFEVNKETKIEFFDDSKAKMFYLWFHSKFVKNQFSERVAGLDKVRNKEKYPKNFKITFFFEDEPHKEIIKENIQPIDFSDPFKIRVLNNLC